MRKEKEKVFQHHILQAKNELSESDKYSIDTFKNQYRLKINLPQ